MQACTLLIAPNWVIMLTNVSLWKFRLHKDPQCPAAGNGLGPSPSPPPQPAIPFPLKHWWVAPHELPYPPYQADWKVWQKLVWSVKGRQPEGGKEGLSLRAPGLTHPSPL